jgi:hypothetical protein
MDNSEKKRGESEGKKERKKTRKIKDIADRDSNTLYQAIYLSILSLSLSLSLSHTHTHTHTHTHKPYTQPKSQEPSADAWPLVWIEDVRSRPSGMLTKRIQSRCVSYFRAMPVKFWSRQSIDYA